MKQTPTHYTPAKIQYLLKEAGITQRAIAYEQGVSEIAVSDVINFRLVSKRLMKAVARHIDADPKHVFAWYFDQRRPRRPSQKRSDRCAMLPGTAK